MATETALELDPDAAGYTGSEPVHFPGFPGVWAPDRPIAVAELGFESEDAALDLASELALPLREVKVDAGSAPMPARPNHLIDSVQQDVLDRELAEQPKPRTHDEVNALADAAGVQFPDEVKTVKEKLAFLDEQAAQGEPDETVEA